MWSWSFFWEHHALTGIIVASSYTQWCSVNTTPSYCLTCLLRQSAGVWHMEPVMRDLEDRGGPSAPVLPMLRKQKPGYKSATSLQSPWHTTKRKEIGNTKVSDGQTISSNGLSKVLPKPGASQCGVFCWTRHHAARLCKWLVIGQ